MNTITMEKENWEIAKRFHSKIEKYYQKVIPLNDGFVKEINLEIDNLLSLQSEEHIRLLEEILKNITENEGCEGVSKNDGWCCAKHKMACSALQQAIEKIKSNTK